MSRVEIGSAEQAIEPGDLIPDRALRAGDPDEFDLAPIADRVADLSSAAETPVNVALFSPWGSGKSSLSTLIERRLKERADGTKLIRYDAWRYGGKELRRNFIAHAARELKVPREHPEYAEFHRGLYENQRRVSIEAPRIWRAVSSARLLPAIGLALALGFTGLLVGAGSVLAGGLISAVLLLVAAVIDAAKVEVEQSRPSEDEEFFERFTKLVEWATTASTPTRGARGRLRRRQIAWRHSLAFSLGLYRLQLWWAELVPGYPMARQPARRLVFFIDELDRCSREDIVKTLKALRTFLDADRCAFIVAADRKVLEEALQEAEQSTPAELEAPYYTTAGAYLDKIFQHQLALPPLRGRRLTSFSGVLVERQIDRSDGSGFWRDLREADEGEALEDVLYALIPSHVRSPRRVKVLLNNFVVASKLAQARDLYGIERAPQIAKLVALRTEFPLFAAELFQEPQLPDYFVGAVQPPQHRQAAIEALLAKVRRADPAAFIEDASEEESNAGRKRRGELDEVARRHREELRRYLERTAEIRNPGTDLLYLEAPGKIFDLDPDLGERIERDAPDVPEEVLAELADADDQIRRKAALLLADMVQSMRGPERARVMTVLMGLAANLRPLGSSASAIARALRTYRTAEGLNEDHLVGALVVAISEEDRSFPVRPLVQKIFADDRLLKTAERIAEVANLTSDLNDGELQLVQAAIGEGVVTGPFVLLAPLGTLAEDPALRLIDSNRIWEGVTKRADDIGESEAAAFLGKVQRAGLRKESAPRLALAIQERLLRMRTPASYQAVSEYADSVLASDVSDEEANDHVLAGWELAPPPDWEQWNERLRD